MSLQVWLPFNGNLNNQGLSNLSFSGSPTFESGKLGQSARFGGNSNRAISATKVTLGSQVTISFWIKIVSWVGWGRVYNLYDTITNTSFNACIWQTAGSIGTQLYSNGTKIHDSYAGDLSDFKWHHFTVVVDNSSKKHYLDGNLVGSWTIDSGSSMPSSIEYTVMVGGNKDNGTPSDMNINDFRIYDHALSDKEIKEISKGLIAHYTLEISMAGRENLFIGTSMTANERTVHPLLGKDPVISTCFRCYNGSISLHSFTDDTDEISLTSTGNIGIAFQRNAEDIDLDTSSYYTISCEAKCDKPDASISLSISYYNGTDWIWRGGTNLMPFNNTTDWQKFKLTFIPDADTQYICYNFTVPVSNEDVSSNYKFCIKHCKLEKGTEATPYTLNREDADYTRLGLNSGIEYDCSGLCYNGTKYGNITIESDSPKYITSSIFNGTDAYIAAPAMTLNMSNITFSFWAKWSDFKSWSRIFDFAQNTSKTERNGFSLCCCNEGTSGTLYINGANTENELFFPITKSNITLNTWYHVVITISDTTGKVYINNELIATVQTLTVGNVSSNYNYIGKSNYPGDSLFEGNISDFRIYATALSAEDVKELYSQSASVTNNGTIMGLEFVES